MSDENKNAGLRWEAQSRPPSFAESVANAEGQEPRRGSWSALTTQGTKLKREQLHREIGRLKDATERANLEHTYSKLFMFLEDDLERVRLP
jgi:hypothetical protein